MYGIKANYYKIKADILYKQSKYSDALLEMQKAFYLDSSLANVISIAQIYNQLGQFNDIVNLTRPYIKKTFEPNLYYYTILAYYNLNEIDSAMYLLSIAHKLDNTNDIFYYMEGLINFSEKNYENAYLNFNVAIELNPKQPNYFFSASKAKIFANTNPSVLNMDGKFVFFNQANIKKFKKLSKKKKSKYYFNRLLAKLSSDPTSMSLDEYFMLYVGNAFQKNFSGYGNTNPQIERYFEQQKYNKCISLANTFLDNNPTSVNTYFFIANSYYSLGKYNLALKYLIPYYGFVEAILATGNGTSPQSPYIVTSIADEYAILRYFGYSFSGQNFLDNKKHAYDIIQYSDGNNKKSIFFNIDLFELNKK
jgi:tetratricopeptide (TPR) repeat protein